MWLKECLIKSTDTNEIFSFKSDKTFEIVQIICYTQPISMSNSAQKGIAKDEEDNIMGKFIVKTTKSGAYRFNLLATNGQVIATSQNYKSQATCEAGVASVKANALAHVEDQTVEGFEVLKHPKYELYQDNAGEFRFRLKASNGQIIATGEGYANKVNCQNGIASIGKNAPEAPVIVEEE